MHRGEFCGQYESLAFTLCRRYHLSMFIKQSPQTSQVGLSSLVNTANGVWRAIQFSLKETPLSGYLNCSLGPWAVLSTYPSTTVRTQTVAHTKIPAVRHQFYVSTIWSRTKSCRDNSHMFILLWCIEDVFCTLVKVSCT